LFAGIDAAMQAGTSVTSAPAASTAEPTAHQSQNQQKHDGSNEGVDDESHDTYPEVDTKLRQKPVTYERADQTDEQVTDQSEATALHHPASQPTSNNSDHEDYEQPLIGQVHDGAFP
jgi:hypothetical protein